MQKICRVHILEALQNLIDDVLLVDIFEDVGTDNCMKIRVHKVEDQINISIVLGANYILQSDDVLMPRQLLQKDNLSKSTLGIRCILKGIKVFLERHNVLGLLINGFPHDTVSALS